MTQHLAPLGEVQFETAAEHYTTNVPIALPTDRAGRVRAALLGQRFDAVAEIVVCDKTGRLVGLVNVEDLLAANEDSPLSTIMDASPPVVTPGVGQEHVAWLAIRRGETSLDVVEDSGDETGCLRLHAKAISPEDLESTKRSSAVAFARRTQSSSIEKQDCLLEK